MLACTSLHILKPMRFFSIALNEGFRFLPDSKKGILGGLRINEM